MTDISKRLGKRIETLRSMKGWSQKDLAELIGEKNVTVSSWETGNRFPREEKLEKLVQIFGVSYDYLLGYEPNKEKSPQPTAEDFTAKDFEFLRAFKSLPLEEQSAILTLAKARNKKTEGLDE